jgi:FkbM family methyltransferase
MRRALQFARVRRFSLLQALFVAVLVGIIAGSLPRQQEVNPELEALAKAYGPDHNSWHHEEWIIRDFFQERRGGVLVDVGASHYQISSNTYYLEHDLGWSGVAVEPMRHFEADYVAHRPRTRFFPVFASDRSDEDVTMYTYGEDFAAASSDRNWAERLGDSANQALKKVVTHTMTLDALLAKAGIEAFDFLSMDIELAEPKALAGLDIKRFRPALVCIEAQAEVRQQIFDYFARQGYVTVGKYLRVDPLNLYFRPAAS